jgi:hypothetical protein
MSARRQPRQSAAIEVVARRYSATRSTGKSPRAAFLRIAGKRVAVAVLSRKSPVRVAEPRLRFDRVAVGLIARLRAAVSAAVPDGWTAVVTITAPIWQDSKTGAALEHRLQELLAGRKKRLKVVIHGNRVEARVLKGGALRTSKLIGFVHNPRPDAAMLFAATRSLLACVGSAKRLDTAERWLVIDDRDGLAPAKTYGRVCTALGVRTVFKRILLVQPGGRVTSLLRM